MIAETVKVEGEDIPQIELGITKDQIKALRNANTVCLDWDKVNGSKIRAIKEYKDNGFDLEKTITIMTETVLNLHGYKRDYTKENLRSCYCHLCCPRSNEVWQSIVSILKVGDKLTLIWVGNNDSQIIEEAGLNSDEILIHIKRGKKTYQFIIETQTSRNNTARMIRFDNSY